jgi:hypothetical protein
VDRRHRARGPTGCAHAAAGAEATRQVGELALPVAVVARELGVCWLTVMDAVVLHGTPLVEDPFRVKKVRALGIDETSFLSATRGHRRIYVTGLVDLDRKRIIDMVDSVPGSRRAYKQCRLQSAIQPPREELNRPPPPGLPSAGQTADRGGARIVARGVYELERSQRPDFAQRSRNSSGARETSAAIRTALTP